MTSVRIKPGAEESLAWCVEPASCSRSIFSSRYERFALSAMPTESLHSFEHIGLVLISRLSYLSPRLRYVTWRYQAVLANQLSILPDSDNPHHAQLFLGRLTEASRGTSVMPYVCSFPRPVSSIHGKGNPSPLMEIRIYIRSITRFCTPLNMVATTSSA